MDGSGVPGVIGSIVDGGQTREVRADRVAEVIRRAGRYRWVGLYDVGRSEIVILAWSGEQAPAYPRFPVTQGLGGAAVSTRRSVVVGDVTRDRRYLTTFGTTRSEMVVPVCDCDGAVTGLIDVESALVDAFGDSDRTALEACARAVGPLFGQRDSDS